MTDRRAQLIREEDEKWAELSSLLARVRPDLVEQPGLADDWSVKDLIGHLGCWWAETAHALERIRLGTYQKQKLDIDEMNRRFYEACLICDLNMVRTELFASRNRALEELWRLPELSRVAEEWFAESGANHYAEHMDDLRRFVEQSDASTG